MTRFLRIAAAGAVVSLLQLGASAQQFQVVQNLPGGHVWSEGLEAADVDNDGDLDMFVANGEGFSSAGTKRQNSLHINQVVESGSLGWSDESVARLGVHESNAKQVVTGDIDADGWIDALFANAFNTDLPFLYVNQGASNPGFYDFDGASRGLTDVLSSGDAVFGDIDNDGDLDLILLDSGSQFVGGGTGGVPQVYGNDGNGFFTLDSGALIGVPNKGGHMDVHLVDIDNDWDLDIFGANHVNDHFLLLNDGSGAFTDASGLIPSTSSNVYEADVADLDGDTDMDMFFVSLTGFNDGPLENDLLPSGPLGFTKGAAATGNDDNEISFCDFDNDGDLDVFIGRLIGPEKIRVNDGGMSFSGGNANIVNINDSTLDCTHADLDNDGDYDFITSQGESVSGSWTNKIYGNGGSPDTLAPVVQRQESLGDCQDVDGPWVVRAVVQDQVMDDGKDWLSAEVIYDVDGNGGSVDGVRVGSGMYRFEMTDTADGLGQELTYQLQFTDWAGNTTTTTPVDVCLCGFGQYATSGQGFANTLVLDGSGDASVGGSFTLTTTNVPAGAAFAANFISLGDFSLPFVQGTLLVDPLQFVGPILVPASSVGGGTWEVMVSIPDKPAFEGLPLYFQTISDDTGPFFNRLSNGLKMTVCP